jgi:c(7)-type cytochrome triheme protein
MRLLIALCIVSAWILGGLSVAAQEKKPPATLTFKAMNGNVTFNHAAHIKREKNDCKVCHDALFQQSATAPLNFKAGMHKPAETKHTSCGFCHHQGGQAFSTTGNCTNSKCHVKGS